MVLLGACTSSKTKETTNSSSVLDSKWQKKSNVYEAKKFNSIKEWKAGQYVITGDIEKGKKKSINRFLVVRQEQQGWVIETSATNDKGVTTASQMLINGYNKALTTGDASNIELVWLKIMDEKGQIHNAEQMQIELTNNFMKSTWEKMITVNLTYEDGGEINVPAGTFKGTSMAKSSVKIMFTSFNQTTWFHSDVPVNGMVKSMSDDGKIVTELLEFGENGKAYF